MTEQFDELAADMDRWREQAAVQHARIDRATDRWAKPRQGFDAFPPYSSVMDKPGDLSQADLRKP